MSVLRADSHLYIDRSLKKKALKTLDQMYKSREEYETLKDAVMAIRRGYALDFYLCNTLLGFQPYDDSHTFQDYILDYMKRPNNSSNIVWFRAVIEDLVKIWTKKNPDRVSVFIHEESIKRL